MRHRLRPARRVVTVVALAVLVPVAAGCGSSSKNAPAAQQVSGVVTAGPACPVQQAGVTCPDTPVRARVVARSGATVVARVGTDAAGAYAFSLPPGTYVIGVEIDGVLPRCPEQTVTVIDRAVRLDVSCDSGIR